MLIELSNDTFIDIDRIVFTERTGSKNKNLGVDVIGNNIPGEFSYIIEKREEIDLILAILRRKAERDMKLWGTSCHAGLSECPLSTIFVLVNWMMDDNPGKGIIDTAIWLVDMFGADNLPDWVSALANGNPGALDAVIEIALADYREEVQRASEL